MPFFNGSDCLIDEEYAIIKNHPEAGSRLLSEHALESASLTTDALKEVRAAVSASRT